MIAHSNFFNFVLLLFLAFVWALTFILTEIILKEVAPFSLVFLRVTIGALTLVIIIRILGLSFSHSWADWKNYFVMGLLNNAIPFSLIFWGQVEIGAGLASILNAVTPFFGAIIAHIYTKDEKIKPHLLIGMSLAFFGILIIMYPKINKDEIVAFLAQLAILGAALSYGFAAVYGKKLMKHHPYVNAGSMLLCTAMMLFPFAVFYDGIFSTSISWDTWIAIFIFGSLCSAVAYMLYFTILKRAGAIYVSTVTLLIPAITIIMAYFYLNEEIDLFGFIGLVFIMLGMCIFNKFLSYRKKII